MKKLDLDESEIEFLLSLLKEEMKSFHNIKKHDPEVEGITFCEKISKCKYLIEKLKHNLRVLRDAKI